MKTVTAVSFREDQWDNSHLLKDCGMVPYMFHELYGYRTVMVGAKLEDKYNNREKYFPNLEMEFLKENTLEERVKYVIKNATLIDLLVIIGVYPVNLVMAKHYKINNPKGKIYLQLDMNSSYADFIMWHEPELLGLSDYCDVIATSCRAVQKMVNIKWPWKVEYIPNGYYEAFFPKGKPDYKKKQDVILTVGRLGTWQKATETLLEAFALISENIPEWRLKLIGTVDEKFNEYLCSFYKRHPELRSRIIEVGYVSDKGSLINEYYNAKVLAMPSRVEGGTPNVISEALRCGCVTALTKFDAYEDGIYNGRCGVAAEIDNVEEYSQCLLSLCKNENLEDMSAHAYKYATSVFDYRKIVMRLHEIIFGGQ